MFVNFCAKVSAAITQLEVGSIAAVGLSRGAYIAIRCAALDPRITALALLAPVTNLQRLEEFNGFKVDEQAFGVFQFRSRLSNRPTLLRMNRTDPRVGTDSALAFVDGFTHLTTQLLDGNGHGIPESTETAAWLRTL
jgi:pimeloyl-ACP methyl ester carboxylesterase